MTPTIHDLEPVKTLLSTTSEVMSVEDCERCWLDGWSAPQGACLWHRHIAKLLAAGYLTTEVGH